jgi:hypothetical protein
MSRYKHGNIALHLGFPVTVGADTFEVVGIDVDDYGDKHGGKQLKELEAEHGELPKTWISTSRALPSGIRFFRVPAGFAFRGKAAEGIDIIQKAHRYAVVWPSWNPDSDAPYIWIDPDGHDISDLDDLPTVDELPELPEAWFQLLTNGGVADANVPVDMDSTDQEVQAWAESAFTGGEPCERMRLAVEEWTRRIQDEESSHDKITQADWQLASLGVEGHTGWQDARAAVAEVYVATTLKRGKRSVGDVRGETGRSLFGVLRKLRAAGLAGGALCPCFPAEGTEDYEQVTAALAPGGAWHPDTPKPWLHSSATAADGDDRASWSAVDIGAALAGVTAPPPTVLARTDGACLFYRGKVHSVHGESESGKSWLVQCATAECLLSGEPVLYIDFEDDAGPVAQRLVRLGVPTDLLVNPQMFAYVRPESPPTRGMEHAAFTELLGHTYTLAVVDGVTDAMGLFGLSSKDADDVAKWHRELPKRIAHGTGAAVVCIDHVAKDSQTRGRFALGSQHKMAGLSGAAYVVEMEEPFAVGQAGTASVRVGKDRPGQVRRLGGRWRKQDRTQHIATFCLDSTDPSYTTWALEVPGDAGSSTEVDTSAAGGSGRKTFRPTWFMEQVSRYWEQTDDASQRTNNKTVKAMCEERTPASPCTVTVGATPSRSSWRRAMPALTKVSAEVLCTRS